MCPGEEVDEGRGIWRRLEESGRGSYRRAAVERMSLELCEGLNLVGVGELSLSFGQP